MFASQLSLKLDKTKRRTKGEQENKEGSPNNVFTLIEIVLQQKLLKRNIYAQFLFNLYSTYIQFKFNLYSTYITLILHL